MKKICIPGKMEGIGGPSSFQKKLVSGLNKRGIQVTFDFDDKPYDVILVINGTRHIKKLWQCKREGIRIIQRLGGINLLHKHLPFNFNEYLVAEIRNLNMLLIRTYFADHIVYQSNFVKEWWEKKHGIAKCYSTIIYNGIDLNKFNYKGDSYKSKADICIISVEGNQGADPFDIAIKVAQIINDKGFKVELLMFGNSWKGAKEKYSKYPFVNFIGKIQNDELPYYYRGSSFYISTDIISAGCPNSVIESLACGTPVLGYNAGVIPEMLDELSVNLVECYGNPWKGQDPDNIEGMINAAFELINNQKKYRLKARTIAEKHYYIDEMIEKYINVLRG